MAQLQSTNVTGTLCVNGVAVGGGKDFKYCCFTSTTSWTPSSDLVDGDGAIDAVLVGGGGGGGGVTKGFPNGSTCVQMCTAKSGGAGGGADLKHHMIPITSTTSCTVTVGAGGGGGLIDFDGTLISTPSAGGNSSLASSIAYGGGVGNSCFQHACNGCFCCPSTGNAFNGGMWEDHSSGERLVFKDSNNNITQLNANQQWGATVLAATPRTACKYFNWSGPPYGCDCSNKTICFASGKRFGNEDIAGASLYSVHSTSDTTDNTGAIGANETRCYDTGADGFGYGGAGGGSTANGGCWGQARVAGGDGTDGIVVIKWYE